jgi:hypothetical protein
MRDEVMYACMGWKQIAHQEAGMCLRELDCVDGEGPLDFIEKKNFD